MLEPIQIQSALGSVKMFQNLFPCKNFSMKLFPNISLHDYWFSRFLPDLTLHYIGQETTTKSGRGTSSVANEAMGAMSLPHTGASSTIEVQVSF